MHPCAGSAQWWSGDDVQDWPNYLSVAKTWRACWRQLAARQTGELSGEPTEREEQWWGGQEEIKTAGRKGCEGREVLAEG
jgi:hypothetical protein